jgi:hypothetical protein
MIRFELVYVIVKAEIGESIVNFLVEKEVKLFTA